MLLPELSRKNTYGMAPSIYFMRGLYRRLTNRNRKKTFVIGFHKTGTTSLAKALLLLGNRVCGFVRTQNLDWSTHAKSELFETAYKPLLSEYDAFEDTLWFLFYKELVEMYPDAHFILTVREKQSWYQSMVRHFGGWDREIFHWVYDGHGDPIGNKELYLEKYTNHNQEVIDYFKSINKELLVMKMPEDFNWEVLCGFLNCSQPFGKFPHANSTTDRNTLKRKLFYRMKSWYYRW